MDGRVTPGALSRRQFLELSSAAPGLLFQQRPSQVVVVGAGLAGLRAAAVLRQAGQPVVVLEARQRPGGRVLTIRSPFDDGLHGEAGPIRISGAHKAVLRAVREHGLPLVPFSLDASTAAPSSTIRSSAVAGRGAAISTLKTDERGLAAGALLARYVGTLSPALSEPATTPSSYAAWQAYDRVTWPDWLLSRGASPEAVRLMTLGGESQTLSALYVLRQFALSRRSNQHYKIAGGMDQLPRAMASVLGDAVVYEAAVVRVERGAGSAVRVDYEKHDRMQSLTASAVIFTVPLTMLRNIEIRPRLSEARQRAIEGLEYYPDVRFLLQSRDRFWNRAGASGSARTERAEIWDCTYDSPTKTRGILGASAGGVVSRTLVDPTSAASVAIGVDVVAEAFPEIRPSFEKGVVHSWSHDPWSRGAFVTFRPGQMTGMMPDIGQPEDRLHFAGEHTSSWMGWMEGALESGERAAREVLRQ